MNKVIRKKWIFVAPVLLASFWFACTSDKIKPEIEKPPAIKLETPETSLVDIDYLLGRTRYHLVMNAKAENVTGKNYLEKEVIADGTLSRAQYDEFHNKILKFVETGKKPAGSPNSELRCQSPFTVRVQDGGTKKVFHGCRSTDDGTFSRLVSRWRISALFERVICLTFTLSGAARLASKLGPNEQGIDVALD